LQRRLGVDRGFGHVTIVDFQVCEDGVTARFTVIDGDGFLRMLTCQLRP
jgi:hypothetical protein